jgi:leucyl-tRNA synthetase
LGVRGVRVAITRKYKEYILQAAKQMRKNPTVAEVKLWSELKSRKLEEIKFRFQVPFDRFILNILCSQFKVIIEVDGASHNEFIVKDKERDHYFKSKGYKMLRFENTEVMNDIENVLMRIKEVCVQRY